MKNVCVITGGGSGIGLATAAQMPKDNVILLAGRTLSKLEQAVARLVEQGYEAHAFACNTSERAAVRSLSQYAATHGTITTVINAAGLSPASCDLLEN